MSKSWNSEQLLAMNRAYQESAVLAAAADLDLFSKLSGAPFDAGQAAQKLQADRRGVTALLDALAALEILDKRGQQYEIPPSIARLLCPGPGSVLAMVQHQANCMRNWSELARTVQSGQPATRRPSIRGADADYAAFVEAMDNVSGPIANQLVAQLQPLHFTHLLDVGGASGTWTIAFLRAHPSATATIFDLPHVIPQARRRIAAAGLLQRVTLVGGDYHAQALPRGADLAWVSAIIHSLSPQQNRNLYANVAGALAPGGKTLIRDFLMDASRITPVGGALFAINMLVATPGGGTYTLAEITADLASAGFTGVKVLHGEPTMHTVVEAVKAV